MEDGSRVWMINLSRKAKEWMFDNLSYVGRNIILGSVAF